MGMEIYRGPSLLDSVATRTGKIIDAGTEVVAIATFNSSNPKTGDEIQTWILRADMSPADSIRTGADGATCGQCIHRSNAAGGLGTCYAHHVARRAGGATWRQNQRGNGDPFDINRFKGRALRLGAYGDPAAIPFDAWVPLLDVVAGWTGYTHQWRHCDPRFKNVCMASCDSDDDQRDAENAGWRVYRVHAAGTPKPANTVPCPSPRIACHDCLKCSGLGMGRRGHVSIPAHGATASRFKSLPLSVVS